MLKPLLATIEQGMVLRRLGRLTENDTAVLSNTFEEIIGP